MKNIIKLIGIIAIMAVIGIALIACDDGEDTHTHTWGNWTQTTAPTCTDAGVETRTCTLDATHKETRAIAVNPTAHNWGEWNTTTEPTCSEKGTESGVCKHDDSHTTTRDIPIAPTAHDWEQLAGTAPTCTETGSGNRKCTICETEETLNIIPALGHDNGTWHTTLAATCTATGTRELRCTRDNHVLSNDTITMLGHDSGAWHITLTATCTAIGTRELRCTRDNAVLSSETITALGHNYANWTQTTAPTCTAAGVDTGTCTHDATHTTTRAGVAALGHDSGAWHTTLDATCTTAGTKQLRCTRDNHILSNETITALGHDFGNWTVTSEGVETRTCTNDATHIETHLTYNLGDTGPGGGKIFFVSETGFTMTDNNQLCHYLEAAPADMSGTYMWASSGYDNTNIANTVDVIGAGRKNTAIILATDTNAPAAKACNDYSNNGKTDWFLPSKYELYPLYANRTSVGNMEVLDVQINHWYWSSSQDDRMSSWIYNFVDGYQGSSRLGKIGTGSVRAVRAF
jgi:hypothetical protein